MTTRLRRYPALGFLAVAALLASLLPSALRVPLSGPSSSAELAPVPGKSDSAQGDLSALGPASTGGLGSGSGLGGLGQGGRGGEASGPGDDDGDSGGGPPGGGRNPAQKRCVGKPPRQTEDPLSPPCVAYFKGDNGGATAKGVTRDEIAVVWAEHRADGCVDSTIEILDFDDPQYKEDPRATFVHHFNERFQLYNRRIHLYVARGLFSCSDSSRGVASVREVEQRLHPFYMGDLSEDVSAAEAAHLGIVVDADQALRSTMTANAPHMVAFPPDLEGWADNVAAAACARLAGRPARFAGDPTLRGTTRKFGLYYLNSNDTTNKGVGLAVDAIRDRCGDAAGEVVVGYQYSNPPRNGTTINDDQDAVVQMRTQGVTTVVVYSNNHSLIQTAEALNWYPEWFVVSDDIVIDKGRPRSPTGWQGAFGLMASRRLGPSATQPQYQAFVEACPGCPLPLYNLKGWYEAFLLLFTAVQVAGPRLTPANVERGFRSIPPRRSFDPFLPAAYFGPADHSFVKDFAMVRWDPTGQPPGTNTVGCWRLVEGGLRYRAEDWKTRPGDDDIHGQNQPCQGDVS